MSTVLPFPTSSIIVNNRKRGTSAARVKALADSIQQLGLLNPIIVTHEGVLVAGLHRLEAALSLGWGEIPAHVVTLDALHAELAEIDENLIRNELSELQECTQLARRKAIYEALFPATKHGGDRKSEEAKSKRHGDDLIANSFAKDSADKMSKSQRTVERKVKVGEALGDFIERLLDTPVADSQKALLALAQMDEAEREGIVELLETGEAQTIGQARKIIQEEAQAYIPPGLPRDISDRALLICGTIEDDGYQIDDESIDAIITAPPRSHLEAYEELAILAARVLRPGGSLLCVATPEYLPAVMAAFSARLAYHWTISAWERLNGFPMHKINNQWSPVLWFVKGAYKGHWTSDVIEPGDGRAALVQLTLPGQTILDPLMAGDALTGLAALSANRRFIGISSHLSAVEAAWGRLQSIAQERAAAD